MKFNHYKQANLSNIQANLGDIQANLGDIQANLGNIQVNLGDIQANLGDIQANQSTSLFSAKKRCEQWCKTLTIKTSWVYAKQPSKPKLVITSLQLLWKKQRYNQRSLYL